MSEDNEDFLDEELLDSNSIDNIDIDEENKGLYEHLNITVDPKQEPLRIDKFLLIPSEFFKE
jgi:23S rRNA pseudouridine1911/1915/1917 synthase